jgi:hypothetical protein
MMPLKVPKLFILYKSPKLSKVIQGVQRRECDRLKELTSIHQQKESLFKEPNDMGFGLTELRLLFYTKDEVAAANRFRKSGSAKVFLGH